MRRSIRLALPLLALAWPLLPAAAEDVRFDVDQPPIWDVTDRRPVPAPSPSDENEVARFVDVYWFRPLDDLLAIRPTFPALDVNALDEVPASTWYLPGKTGSPAHLAGSRAIRAPITPTPVGGLERGGPWTVLEGSLESELPYLILSDPTGARLRVDFDEPGTPELRTAATVISSRLLDAAGYDVSPAEIAALGRDDLALAGGALEILAHGGHAALRAEGLDRFFAARSPAGEAGEGPARVRVAVAPLPAGILLGGFPAHGVRADDPNDLIAHQARRSLRGLAILAAWLDHARIREDRTCDVYLQPENYVRHTLTGLGLTLGNARARMAGGPVGFSGLHAFHPRLLDPLAWKPDQPYEPFAAMQWADALWGTRLLLSFTDDEIATAVAAGRYSDPQVADYVAGALRERRDRIGRAWCARVNASDRFAVGSPSAGRWTLEFADLGVRAGLRQPEDVVYLMTMRVAETGEALGYQSRGGERLQFDITAFAPGEWMHRLDPGRYLIAEILGWNYRGGALLGRTRVHLYFDRSSGPRVVGIVRD